MINHSQVTVVEDEPLGLMPLEELDQLGRLLVAEDDPKRPAFDASLETDSEEWQRVFSHDMYADP